MGTSFGGKVALWLAVQQPGAGARRWCWKRRLRSARPGPSRLPARRRRWRAGFTRIPSGSARCRSRTRRSQAKARALVARLRGPDRDADLEAQMRRLPTPTLVLFGTLDRVIPPEMGRLYKELLPNCHLVFVYDAGHAISTERPEAFAEVTADFSNATRRSSSAAPKPSFTLAPPGKKYGAVIARSAATKQSRSPERNRPEIASLRSQ